MRSTSSLFNLMLAVQAASDLAVHLITDEGWASPPTAGESFDRLAEHQVITRKTAAALRRAVGFHNVAAHGYAGIDVTATHAASTVGLDDLDRFARESPAGSQTARRWSDDPRIGVLGFRQSDG